ncbi:hypothetical protein Trydic_g546 [Trypoxylus dichotomus]
MMIFAFAILCLCLVSSRNTDITSTNRHRRNVPAAAAAETHCKSIEQMPIFSQLPPVDGIKGRKTMRSITVGTTAIVRYSTRQRMKGCYCLKWKKTRRMLYCLTSKKLQTSIPYYMRTFSPLLSNSAVRHREWKAQIGKG